MKLSQLLLLALALTFAAVAQPNSGRYALILSDAPLARPAETPSSRSARRARIESAHASLRSALAARQLKITGEVETVLNAVFVAATPDRVAELRSLPGVSAVIPLRRRHLMLNKAVPAVNGPAAWQTLGGQQNAGRGIKIAIIDTGIDQNHPAFQDSTISTPAGFPICPNNNCSFTNNKVIVARSYIQMEAAGTGSNPAATSRPDDYTPRDRIGHGTATSSTTAGNTNTGPSATITGMAPHAFLGNYKVFGTSAFASDDAIIQAVEDAVNDGMDVLSLSLGSSAFGGPLDTGATCGNTGSTPCDPLAFALDSAVQEGKIVVAAAGNDGLEGIDASGNTINGVLGTIASPGYAPQVIAAGATSNLHMWVAQLHLGGSAPSNLQSIAAEFGDGPLPNGTLTGPLVDVTSVISDPKACSTIPANSLQADFVLIERGTCNFSVKVENAQSAGAIGVILYDTTTEPIFTPGGLSNTQIPAVLISLSDGQALKSFIDSNPSTPVTLDPTPFEYILTGPPIVSDFSSRGPVLVTGAIKPDIAAVGQDMYMATQKLDAQGELYSPDGYTVADGTSFATPLVAGAAALIKQKNSAWTPAQVMSAIVNNASQALTGTAGGNASVLEAGGGLLDANAALNAVVSAVPSSVSFGILNSSTLPLSQTLQITNLSGAAEALTIAVVPTSTDANAHVSVSPSSMSLGAGQGASLTVTLSGTLPQPGKYEGVVTISTGSSTIRIPYLYLMGSGTPYAIIDLNEGPPDFEGTVSQPLPADEGGLFFKVIDQYGVPVSGITATFASQSGGQVTTTFSPTDSNGIAAAYITLGPTPGDQSFTGSAGGLTMTFTGVARRQPVIASGGVVRRGHVQRGRNCSRFLHDHLRFQPQRRH